MSDAGEEERGTCMKGQHLFKALCTGLNDQCAGVLVSGKRRHVSK